MSFVDNEKFHVTKQFLVLIIVLEIYHKKLFQNNKAFAILVLISFVTLRTRSQF